MTEQRRLVDAVMMAAVVFFSAACGQRLAKAHQVVLFAAAEGERIVGEAFFRGGGPVREARVRVLAPDGAVLGEAVTDEEGKFSFPARFRCDHHLVLDVGEGHSAEYVVPADELPATLPRRAPASRPANASGTAAPASAEPSRSAAADGGDPVSAKLDALARQVVQLRQQIARYEKTTRWHDVLGGIGYIFGLAGVAFYFLGARKAGRSSRPEPPQQAKR